MKIPGRVGYQCSNFYRLLLETKQITDPNYVLDENGKARYLFDKKDASGKVHKAFRTHRPSPIEEDNINSSSSGKRRRATRSSSSASAATTNNDNNATSNNTQQRSGRRRRRRFAASDESDNDDDDGGAYVDGEYRSGRSRARMVDTTQSNDGDTIGRRRSKRQRKPTVAAIEAGLVAESRPSCSWETSITGTTTQEQHGAQSAEKDDNDDESTINNNEQNPLPGFIDPITLTEVVKPAISKYGHVMG